MSPLTLILVAIALVLKLALWAAYGPLHFPDSSGYASYADIIAEGRWPAFDDPLSSGAFPLTAMRTIGYPALLALAKLIGGGAWDHIVVGVQILAGLAVVGGVTAWTETVTQSAWRTVVVALAVATGQAMIYDLAILPDSLFSSAFVALLLILVGPPATVSSAPPSEKADRTQRRAIQIGLLAGFMILLRANGLHLLIFFLPLAFVWVSRQPAKRFVAAAAMLIPAIVTVAGYTAWNEYRAGQSFLSTGGQLVAYQPLYQIASRGTPVFDEDTVLDRTVQNTTTEYDYGDIYALNETLYRDEGWTALEIHEAGISKFMETIPRYPGAVAENMARNFSFNLPRTLINPAGNAVELLQYATGDRLFPGFSKIVKAPLNYEPADWAYALVYGGFAILSLAVYASFLFLTPFGTGLFAAPRSGLMRDRSTGQAEIFLLWLGLVGMQTYYSLIHLELRYLIAVVPFATALGLAALPQRRRRRSKSGGLFG